MADKPKDTRSVEQIRADLAAARARMGANVEGLVTEVHPKAVKQRTIDDTKAMFMAEVDNAKSQVKDEDGWRTDRLTLAGAVAGAAVLGLAVVRLVVSQARKGAEKRRIKREVKAEAKNLQRTVRLQAKEGKKIAAILAEEAAKRAKKAQAEAGKQAAQAQKDAKKAARKHGLA